MGGRADIQATEELNAAVAKWRTAREACSSDFAGGPLGQCTEILAGMATHGDEPVEETEDRGHDSSSLHPVTPPSRHVASNGQTHATGGNIDSPTKESTHDSTAFSHSTQIAAAPELVGVGQQRSSHVQ